MKLSNRTTFTGWFGLAAFGLILVTLNELVILSNAQVDTGLKIVSAAISVPGILLIGRYCFLISQRLEDGERERADLQQQVDELLRARASVGSAN